MIENALLSSLCMPSEILGKRNLFHVGLKSIGTPFLISNFTHLAQLIVCAYFIDIQEKANSVYNVDFCNSWYFYEVDSTDTLSLQMRQKSGQVNADLESLARTISIKKGCKVILHDGCSYYSSDTTTATFSRWRPLTLLIQHFCDTSDIFWNKAVNLAFPKPLSATEILFQNEGQTSFIFHITYTM